MRKSFDGLSGLIAHHTQHNIRSGDVYIFINKRADRIKLLQWEGTGFGLYYKRLEKGTFERPLIEADCTTRTLAWSELIMLLEGIQMSSIKRRKRYSKTG